MRKLITTDISNSIAMPIKGGTLDHVQFAYQEAVSESIKGLIGNYYDPNIMYILNGCVNSGSGANFNISAGSVFYQGEVFLVDNAVFTVSGTNVAVAVLNVTYFSGPTADGVEFSDGIVRNVHQIRKVQFTGGLAGSQLANYADCQRINTNIAPVNLIAGSGIGITGAYPNLTIANTSPNTNKILKTGYIFVGDLNTTTDLDAYTALLAGSNNGISAYRYNFPVALPDANYKVMATFGNNGDTDWGGFNDNYMCGVQVGAIDNAGFYFAIHTTATSNRQYAAISYVIVSTL